MDAMREFMGDVDHSYDPNAVAEDPDEDTVEIDNTLAPSGMSIKEVLMDRHWTFEEVLFIKGSSTHLSRKELQETVADAKGVDLSRVDVCFFDEDDLTHPLVAENMLAAGPPQGDVVCVWCTKYAPAAHKRYSRKWAKIKSKMDTMPRRWYLVTAIRKDGLLDDEADQHLSAEEVIEEVKVLSLEEEKDKNMWIPPAFDDRNKLTLKQQLIKEKRDAEEAAAEAKRKEEAEREARKSRNTRAAKNRRTATKKKVEGGPVKALPADDSKQVPVDDGGMTATAAAVASEAAQEKSNASPIGGESKEVKFS
jgi:hypothetical protein